MEENHYIKRRRLEGYLGNGNGVDARKEEIVPWENDRVLYINGSGPRSTGREEVSVTMGDTRGVNRGQWVKDSIIGFGIDYIRNNLIKKELRDTIHFCNTIFFTRFTEGINTEKKWDKNLWKEHIKKGPGLKVTRENRGFDIFKKDYIIIPVNDQRHWFTVAIINPAGALLSNEDFEGSQAAPKCYIVVYDPASGLNGYGCAFLGWAMKIFLEMVCEQFKGPNAKFGGEHGFTYDSERVSVVCPKNGPIQDNHQDCGIFILHFIEGLFCHFKRPIGLQDAPDFDWSRLWPLGENMADLGRDKVYNWIEKTAGPTMRSRLAKFERANKFGLGLEGDLRRSRRHSAAAIQRKLRNEHYESRFFSCDPPEKKIIQEDRMFRSPRALASQKKVQLVRRIVGPECSVIY